MGVVNATRRPPYPLGNRPGTHCIGGWVGPRDGLGECVKSRPHRDSIPGSSSPYRFVIPFIKASKKHYSIKYSLIWCAV